MIDIREPSIETAYKWLKKRGECVTMTGARLMYKKAIDELEYRIPKRPEPGYMHREMVPTCPKCGYEIDDEDYCPVCGQAIDWSDMEEET